MNVERLVVGDLETNCYLLYLDDSECIVVDAGGEAERIATAIEEKGLSPIAIVLTHSHFDHILAAPAIRDRYRIPILIHESDAANLNDPQSNFSALFDEPISFKADKTLVEGDVVELGDESLTVLHTPGHSRGSICLLSEDILVAGDLIFKAGIGRTDLPDGNYKDLVSSIERILKLPDSTVVFPGHGPRTSIGSERASLEEIR